MEVKVKKLHKDATIPTYSTDGSGCFDIYSAENQLVGTEGVEISTGLSFEVPKDHVMLVYSRSGMGIKYHVRLSNCVGVIDSDYRGELIISLLRDVNLPYGKYRVEKGDRIAQGMIMPIPKINFVEVEELSDTDRGLKGFGSTGK